MATPLPPLLLKGSCLEELKRIPDESVDAVVTDPPYGLANTDPAHVVEALTKWASGERDFLPTGRGFMGKEWDAFVPSPAVWDECMRILKPGGHLLAFAGSRTFDLMTLSVRMAGFDIRDSIAWLYGSGFPKSMDVSKAIDKTLGAQREKVRKAGAASAYSEAAGNDRPWMQRAREDGFIEVDGDEPATAAAREWQGWGTALKPAFEPIVVARKPLAGTVAANVLAHGTGALNIDATRIEASGERFGGGARGSSGFAAGYEAGSGFVESDKGRHPANVVLDESQAAALDAQSGTLTSGKMKSGTKRGSRQGDALGTMPEQTGAETLGDSGGASRFFYVAKAPRKERPVAADGTAHPTVKPLALMRWLVKLVTPLGGVIIDPFAGSGTTLEAAYLEGFESIGVELTPDYWPLIEQRIARVTGAAAEMIFPVVKSGKSNDVSSAE